MPLKIIRQDITKLECDAIVNAANSSLLGGGGVDGAIHRAAGPKLLEECRGLGGCQTGDAKITYGYNLPAKYVIHTVGPVYAGGNRGERELLISCYKKSLDLALSHGCESVAFPLISSGVYGYPKPEAFRVAVDTCLEFLKENEMLIYIVVFDKHGYNIGKKNFADLDEFIDQNYVSEQEEIFKSSKNAFDLPRFSKAKNIAGMVAGAVPCDEAICESIEMPDFELDESFTEMVLRKIDEKGMTDPECYKRANIDRKLFSKIRSDIHYRPSKMTAMALGLSLELPMNEFEELLQKAGFALSKSDMTDVIIDYAIRHKIYDIFAINEALFSKDLATF